MLARTLAGTITVVLPKLQSARARTSASVQGRGLRVAMLGAAIVLFWALLFEVVHRLLSYFSNVPEVGPLLAGKLLGLIMLSFLGLLLLSNVITALSTFFLARDLDMLVSTPLDWGSLYTGKLLETCVNSSWMVIAMSLPLFAAYGSTYDGGWWYPLVVAAAFIPFVIIPSALGYIVALLLVNVFSAHRTKEFLGVLAVVAIGGLAMLFRLMRPERLARPEGFRSLADFLAQLRAPAAPWLPSEWVRSAVLGWLRYEGHAMPFVLLWITAITLVAAGAVLHRGLFMRGFGKAQESNAFGTPRPQPRAARLLGFLPTARRELVLKELRIFFRDSTQWSQLILLIVLVAVYIFNVRMLPLHGGGVTFFLANVIPFLNLGLAGFVLASIAARFLFPSISLEGRTWWLLRSSPLRMRDLVWAKYWVGTIPLLIVAVAMIATTDALLDVSRFMTILSITTVVLLTLGIGGVAIGTGSFFPQFDTENAAQVPTSLGGLVFMMASIALVGTVIVLEARPVYAYVSARAFGTDADTTDIAIGLASATTVCVIAAWLPLRAAVRRLNAIER